MKLKKSTKNFLLPLLLTIFSLGLWEYSVSQATLTIGFFGLIHSLPFTFFIASTLLTIAFIYGCDLQLHKEFLFFQICILILVIWMTPLLLGASQPTEFSPYRHFANTEYIIRNGYLFPEKLWYHDWPGTWILCTSFMEILDIDKPDLLIKLAPLCFQFLFLLPLYLIFKKISTHLSNRLMGVWLFYIGNWIGQSYLAPQSFGYFFFLVLTYLLIKEIRNNSYSIKSLLLIMLFASLNIYHVLTVLLVLITFITFYIFKKFRAKFLIIAEFALFLSWTMYGVTWHFKILWPNLIMNAFRLDLIWEKSISERFITSESHRAVNFIKILTTGVFLMISFIGFLIDHNNKKRRNEDKIALLIELSIMLLTILLGYTYGFEMSYRTYFFSLPIMAFFGSKLINKRITKIFLSILLVLLFPLHFVSHYGNQDTDYMSPSNLRGVYYFSENINEGVIINSGADPIGFLKNIENYYFADYNYFYELRQRTMDRSVYISISRLDQAVYRYQFNNPQNIEFIKHLVENSPDFVKIYQSSGLILYKYQG